MKVIPYKFTLVGMSGKGKTMAFRNMNPTTCGFINMENKPLPFINNFTHYDDPKNYHLCYQKLIEYAKNDEIKEVVLDSFSGYIHSLLKSARDQYKNYDIWNFYNAEIGKLLYLIKTYPKDLIMTAHYEWIEGESGVIEKYIAVKGKEWKCKIEENFTITHFADMKFVDQKRKYIIELNSDGKSSAKTLPIFLIEGEETIENDYHIFLQRVREVLSKSKTQ